MKWDGGRPREVQEVGERMEVGYSFMSVVVTTMATKPMQAL